MSNQDRNQQQNQGGQHGGQQQGGQGGQRDQQISRRITSPVRADSKAVKVDSREVNRTDNQKSHLLRGSGANAGAFLLRSFWGAG